MSRSAFLLVAAQIAIGSGAFVGHLRPVAQKTDSLSFSGHIWNNTITRFVQNDILLTEANPQPVDKVVYVLLCMVFGCCGCDRCFMGQTLLGVLKGITFGGFIIWQLIDYFTCLYCALTKMKRLDMMGYDVTFKPNTIENAFWLSIILLVLNLLQQHNSVKVQRQQMEQQQELEKNIHAAMMRQMDANAASQSPPPTLNIPMRQQVIPHAPVVFAKALRKAGLLNKHASVPELIKAFTDMDKDGDGQLDRDELKSALSALGMGEDEVDQMIKDADQDGDGKISKDEFLSYHARREAEKAAKKEAEKKAEEPTNAA